jgi:hypothetical protein
LLAARYPIYATGNKSFASCHIIPCLTWTNLAVQIILDTADKLNWKHQNNTKKWYCLM